MRLYAAIVFLLFWKSFTATTCTDSNACAAYASETYCCKNNYCKSTFADCGPAYCTTNSECILPLAKRYCCSSGRCLYNDVSCPVFLCSVDTDCSYAGATAYCCQYGFCLYSSTACSVYKKTYDSTQDTLKTIADVLLSISVIYFAICAGIMICLLWKMCSKKNTGNDTKYLANNPNAFTATIALPAQYENGLNMQPQAPPQATPYAPNNVHPQFVNPQLIVGQMPQNQVRKTRNKKGKKKGTTHEAPPRQLISEYPLYPSNGQTQLTTQTPYADGEGRYITHPGQTVLPGQVQYTTKTGTSYVPNMTNQ